MALWSPPLALVSWYALYTWSDVQFVADGQDHAGVGHQLGLWRSHLRRAGIPTSRQGNRVRINLLGY